MAAVESVEADEADDAVAEEATVVSVPEAEAVALADAESVLATLAVDAEAEDAAAEVEAALAVEPLLEVTAEITHDFSSWTSGVPLWSVIGVIVMVHVSSIGPAELYLVSVL